MRNYDFEKAKRIVEENKDKIVEAILGMKEDWFWTADTVWENGEFTKELNNETLIGGINGSAWATPSIMLVYKDEDEETEMFTCYVGDRETTSPPIPGMSSGPLSGPTQENLPNVKEYEGVKRDV